ncbi:hypothetical protein EV356DRAFT_572668 [Viridothelium virens]|uniref:Uncharacterized protein n=1 Tax=Viridothelium virens TaxID=1048519 RepID=A0A6A6HMG3_VIRVR|nr:hypothetical protein EV356DRAFT_572668 [Viridothelium virens]
MAEPHLPYGGGARVLVSKLISISPPHRPEGMQSQRSLACTDEYGNSIPRDPQINKDADTGIASDHQRPSTSKATEIEEIAIGDDTIAPNTTHSQNLAERQAQCDMQTQRDCGSATPSPTKRGDNINKSGSRELPAQGLPVQLTSASRSARPHQIHQNLTEDDSRARKVDIGDSHGQSRLETRTVKTPNHIWLQKLDNDERSGEAEHGLEKAKLDQWEKRKQRFVQENSRRNPKTKARVASKTHGSRLQESSETNVKTISVQRSDAPASTISRAKLTKMTRNAHADAHCAPPPPSSAQSSKSAAALAQLDFALPPAHESLPKSRVEVSKMPQKLIRRLQDGDKQGSPINTSPREPLNKPRNAYSPMKIGLSNVHDSGSKISPPEPNKTESNGGLDIFELEVETGLTPAPPKAKASITSKRGKGRKTDHAARNSSSKNNSSSKKSPRAAQRQARVQKSKDGPTALNKKASSTKDGLDSPKLAETAKPQHHVDTRQTSHKFDPTASRETNRSQAVRTIQDDDRTKRSTLSPGKNLQGLSRVNATVTKGAGEDEKEPSEGLQEQDQEASYEHFEQEITHIRDGEDEVNIMITDGERQEIAPAPKDDSHEQKPAHSRLSGRERTNPTAQTGHDKEMANCSAYHTTSPSASVVEEQAKLPLGRQSTHTIQGRKRSLENQGPTQVQGNEASAKKVLLYSTSPIDSPAALKLSLDPELDVQPHIDRLQSPEMGALPREDHRSILKPNSAPEEKSQGRFSSAQHKEPLAKGNPKTPLSSSGDLRLQFNAAPKLPLPAKFNPLPVSVSSICHLQQSITPANAIRHKGETQSSDLVDEKMHRKSPIIHFTALGPMNQGVTTSSTLGTSKGEVSEKPAPQKRHAEEPLGDLSELRQAKRPLVVDEHTQTTAESEDRLGRTTHAGLQKHSLQSTQQNIRGRSTQISDNGSPLPIMVDDSGRQRVLGALSDSGHEELRAPPKSAYYDLATAQTEQDEDLSNAAASYCTVPTQILSQPPNFFSSNTKARPQAPTAVSQAISGYASVRVVEQSVRKAERELDKEIGLFASPSKSPPKDHPTAKPKTTRFMRSLRAQMDTVRTQKDGVTERRSVEDPGATLVEGQCHHRDGQSYTSTSTASTEDTDSEEAEEEEDPLAVERREAVEWGDALRPHQREVVAILSRITREVVRHLVAADEAVDQLVGDYGRGGAELIESMERAHGEELEGRMVELKGRKEAMRRLLSGVEAKVFNNGRDVRSLGLRKEVVAETQEHHENVMSGLQELTAGL